MTETTVNTMDSRRGRWVKTVRGTTRGLRVAANNLQSIGITVIVAVAGANIAGIGPDWISQGDRNHVALLMLAVWGLVSWLQPAMEGVADSIDPDARDGDALFTVTEIIRDVAADVRQGADLDDILFGVQTSGVLLAVHDLLDSIGTEYVLADEPLEAEAMQEAATSVGDAYRTLGGKNA